ncbi:MAG: hypothetical protein KDJ80_09065 [Nitratireductor sp.]|nr:hypothetical protein [Nitratireductor sp.]
MEYVLYMIMAIGGAENTPEYQAFSAAQPVAVGKFKSLDNCTSAASSSAKIVASTPGTVAAAHFICVQTQ